MNLYSKFNVKPPESPISEGRFGYPLIHYGLMEESVLREMTPAEVLRQTIILLTNFAKKHPRIFREENRDLVRETLMVNIHDPQIIAIISHLYGSSAIATLGRWEKIDYQSMAILSLKLGLDYAIIAPPKIQYGPSVTDFTPITLGNNAEAALGTILEIISEAQASGINVSTHIQILEILAPHIWRAPVIKSLNEVMKLRSQTPEESLDLPEIEERLSKVTPHIDAARLRVERKQLADLEDVISETTQLIRKASTVN